jgi:hypothetical protein
MSKFGWNDIQDRFYLATGKLHDSEQFGFRYRELKKIWLFIEELQHVATSVGNRDDGSVIASDKWWEDKLGSNKVHDISTLVSVTFSSLLGTDTLLLVLCTSEQARVVGPKEWMARIH